MVSFVYFALGLETDQVWYKCVSQDPPSLALDFAHGLGEVLLLCSLWALLVFWRF